MVRSAELADFEAITGIRQATALDVNRLSDAAYRVQIQRSGFLLPLGLTHDQFAIDLPRYTVAEADGEVAGYMRVDEIQEMDEVSSGAKVAWLQPALRETYFSLPHADVGGVGVSPTVGQRGLATELLQAAEQRTRARGVPYLFSFVVVSPVTNVPSMMFHEKHGFQRVAVMEPRHLYGMDGYQSLLYGKKLES